MALEWELCILDRDIAENNTQVQVQTDSSDVRSKLLRLLLDGHYEALLDSEVVKEVFSTAPSASDELSLESVIERSVECFLKQHDLDDHETREFVVLCIGISCLQIFVQNNWTGPPTEHEPSSFLKCFPQDKLDDIKTMAISALSVDGEPPYELAVYPGYLAIAKGILLNCRQHIAACRTADLWLMRCLQIQQNLLNERSPSLKNTIMDLISNLTGEDSFLAEDRCRNIEMQFRVEAGHLCYFYYEPSQSSEHFNVARKVSRLNIELTGVMGKRTRYQKKSLAQLMLKVERPPDQPAPDISSCGELPKNIDLQDDTVLNEILVEEDEQFLHTKLTAAEQALLLALCHEHKKHSESQGDILKEECLAFVNKVLSQPQTWCVQSMALLLRTYWESESARRMERTMAQLEELVKQFKIPSERPSHRTHLLYCSRWQPKWYVQKELGELMLKIGVVKSALDIFLPLQLWEDIIRCYQMLGRTEAAEKVVRAQLAIKETPAMWCHLGDVLNDPECYQRAWKLSEEHFPRAQRALALYYLRKGQFQESLPCFEKTLAINPLQVGVWFSFGCAGMAAQNWDLASGAFRRCVSLETENFEAWSNLATVYIKSNQKVRAFPAMQEALKCEYENWRLWENYLLLATDIGEFDDAIRAYNRLIDLKHKYSDAEVIGVLVKAVTTSVVDASGQSASRLRPRLQELLGRVTSTVTTNSKIWGHYATLLTEGTEDVSSTDRQRALQYLQKSLRCLTQAPNWEKDVSECVNITERAIVISQTYRAVAEGEENVAQATQLLSSARLMLKGILAKIKKQHTDPATDTLLVADLQQPCKDLDEELSNIVTLSTQITGN